MEETPFTYVINVVAYFVHQRVLLVMLAFCFLNATEGSKQITKEYI